MAYSLYRERFYTVWGKQDVPRARWKLMSSTKDSSQAIALAKAFDGYAIVISIEDNMIRKIASEWSKGRKQEYLPYENDQFIVSSTLPKKTSGATIIPRWGVGGSGEPVLYGYTVRTSSKPTIESINQMIDVRKFLQKHLGTFYSRLGVSDLSEEEIKTLIRGHGGECTIAAYNWAKQGISHAQGAMVYFLTFVHPYRLQVRETAEGWVDPFKWVEMNFDRFKDLLPAIDYTDPEIESLWQR